MIESFDVCGEGPGALSDFKSVRGIINLYINRTKNLYAYCIIKYNVNMSNLIPSVFNRIDFWAMLLPGYVVIILGMTLFLPSFLFPNFGDGNSNTGTEENSTTDTNTTVGPRDIQFDIFSAVVFIVAGPAIGFTMSQAVIFFSFLIFFQDKYKFLLAYSHLRTVCCNDERSELDAMDARIIFNSSTGVGLLLIAFLLVIQDQLGFERFSKPLVDADLYIRIFISILIIVIGIILIASAWLEVSRIRLPLVCGLLKKYNIDRPAKCEKYK